MVDDGEETWLVARRARGLYGTATAFCVAITASFLAIAAGSDGGPGAWGGVVCFGLLAAYLGRELLDPRPVIRVTSEGVRLRSPRCDLRWFEIEAVQLHLRRTGRKGAYAWVHLLLTDPDRQIGRERGRAVTQVAFLTVPPSDIVDAIGRGIVGGGPTDH